MLPHFLPAPEVERADAPWTLDAYGYHEPRHAYGYTRPPLAYRLAARLALARLGFSRWWYLSGAPVLLTQLRRQLVQSAMRLR